MRVTKQSGKNTVEIAAACSAEIERINREVPSVRLAVLDDQSKFIERVDQQRAGARDDRRHAGRAIIFLFLRGVRSTLIICTSIPISVIGTFALLYFGGYTLNTLTFGGLALGVGMIVDAAIVVLENTYRHLEMGKDRVTAAIDGSEEVWSAILASTLTHIAVFVPMLFLTGVASITFGSLAAVVSFSLAMSLFVAVTIVPVLCSRFLDTPDHGESRTGVLGALYRWSDRVLNGLDEVYRAGCTWPCSIARPCLRPASSCSSIGALPGRFSASSCSRRPTKAKSRSTPSWRSGRGSKSRKRC